MFNSNDLKRSINCFIHKKHKASHICVELSCQHNPIICPLCLTDSKTKGNHAAHDSQIRGITEGLESICSIIKQESKKCKEMQGKQGVNRSKLDGDGAWIEQLDGRIQNIKKHLEMELQLLVKEFQRQVAIEKQQFLDKLEEHRKSCTGAYEKNRTETNQIRRISSQLKYYSNPNNLLLKISLQSSKKAMEWLMQQKRTLNKFTTSHPSQKAIEIETLEPKKNALPIWIGQRNEAANEKELKNLIKGNIKSWVELHENEEAATKSGSNSSRKAPGQAISPHTTSNFGSYKTITSPYYNNGKVNNNSYF